MKRQEVESLFTLAGIPFSTIKNLIDGYGYPADDPRFITTLPRCAWWFVKTPAGWIEIGERKRVLSIDWSDTPVRKIITEDATSKELTMVHAWSTQDALKYLTALASHLSSKPQVTVEVRGGVAEVTKCPASIKVEIIDHDNEGR